MDTIDNNITFTLKFCRRLVVLFLIGLQLFGVHAASAAPLNRLQKLIGSHDAVLLIDPQGKVLFAHNPGLALIPASTLKIFTALVALHYLGPDYRFVTEFYMDPDSNLKVKGYGDPLLISESLWEIAQTLATRLKNNGKSINDLILDDSFFKSPIIIPGVHSSFEPYDAPNGALCVNFNTVFFKRNPDGIYVSAEPQTPLLPMVLDRIHSTGLNQGRIILSHAENEHTFYAGQLLRHCMEQQGLHVNGRIRTGQVETNQDKLIVRYVSEFSLNQIISKLMEHSNNFMANQLLITCGVKAYGPPGTLNKGVRAAAAFAESILKMPGIKIVEGSGISKKNRISARNLATILEAFAPYYRLMRRDGDVYYKTGTLNGINNRAGYIENSAGALCRFVVMVNTPGTSADAIMETLLSNFK